MDRKVSKNYKDMQEKTPEDSKVNEDNSHATNEDIEEFDAVNSELDNISSFLDSLETNVDNIKDQLLTILTSNREILKELKEEKEEQNMSQNGDSDVSGADKSDKGDEQPMET